MHRSMRIGLFVLLLLAVIGGSALAAGGPHQSKTPSFADASESETPDTPPTADELAHAVDRLQAQGVSTNASQLGALAAKYGLGGAVRLMGWTKSSGKTLDELTAMRDAGTGWGKIAHELGVSPGIGWIMGNGHAGGKGKAGAPGQQKDHASDADESENESPEESAGE